MSENSPPTFSNRRGAQNNDDGLSLSAPVIMDLIEAVHEKGASFRFQAKGHSMTPTIRDGDVITVSPLRGLSPRRGDVLAFRHRQQPQMMVHRVLHAKAGEYFIRGDNCPEADGWIPVENILGMITRVERGGEARFWPNRLAPFLGSRVYLTLYPSWLSARRLLARAWRSLRAMARPEK